MLAPRTVDHLARGLAHAHDVVDHDALGTGEAEVPITRRAQLLAVAENEIDLGHLRIGLWFDLCGAAGDDDLGPWVSATRLADRLSRLANGLGSDRTGIDDQRILEPGFAGASTHRLGLIGVEPAAECENLDAHALRA